MCVQFVLISLFIMLVKGQTSAVWVKILEVSVICKLSLYLNRISRAPRATELVNSFEN